MRNVFHQYHQAENQLSHALATVLAREEKLCRRFVQWLIGNEPPHGIKWTVEQQRVPGIPAADPEEGDRKGLPDICIHGDSDWCVAIESKVGASLTADQLRRHRTTLGRCFEKVSLIAITADSKPKALPSGVPHKTWVDVYVWLGSQPERESFWVGQMRDFMLLLESRLVAEAKELPGLLTMFDGIPFGADHPYSYLEAKLLIRQAIPLLRKRKALKALGVDPACSGRSAITGKDSTRVWDFISLKPTGENGGFTDWPHLTLGIHSQITEVMVTMPNSVKGGCRRAFKELGVQGFLELSCQIADNMAKAFNGPPNGYKPLMRVVHRHYKSQRSEAEMDGEMEVDLRTAMKGGKSSIKIQPIWFEAAYRLITERSDCNVQLQMGVAFPHAGKFMKGDHAVEALESGWVACAPLIATLLKPWRQ